MAVYPALPGHRMALDVDGTQAWWIDSSVVMTKLSAGDILTLNNESADAVAGPLGASTGGRCVFYFPEPRDVAGIFVAGLGTTTNTYSVETSTDTTNGLDGTWVTKVATTTLAATVLVAYRAAIVAITAAAVKAVRITVNAAGAWNLGAVHIYGAPTAGANPDRLVLWHPTTNVAAAGTLLDQGDTALGSGADQSFRVKNTSATLTAVAPTLSLGAHTDASPSVPAQYSLSQNGTVFTASQVLPDLVPGAISAVQTLRRVTPTTAAMSAWAVQLTCEATRWA